MRDCRFNNLVPRVSLSPPPRAREERPWHKLDTCLLDFSRLQINNMGEGQVSVVLVTTEYRGEKKVL